ISKPFEVGFTVLELSKLLMYQFHYDHIKAKYGEKARLLFTDTDSLMYHIEANDVYADMRANKEKFDFSGYPPAHPNYDATNCKKIGVFKDETNGMPIIEFVGLMAKMYSYTVAQVDANGDTVVLDKHRAKGIQYQASKRLSHDDYVRMLREPHKQVVNNRRINSKEHRYVCGEHTLAFGHRDIPADEVGDFDADDVAMFDDEHIEARLAADREMPPPARSPSPEPLPADPVEYIMVAARAGRNVAPAPDWIDAENYRYLYLSTFNALEQHRDMAVLREGIRGCIALLGRDDDAFIMSVLDL
ncbi:MAG: hypothetical protein FD142_3217, partial [bacterium]